MQKLGSRVTAGVQDDLKIILAQRSSRCRVLCSPRLRPIWCHHGQMYAILSSGNVLNVYYTDSNIPDLSTKIFAYLIDQLLQV